MVNKVITPLQRPSHSYVMSPAVDDEEFINNVTIRDNADFVQLVFPEDGPLGIEIFRHSSNGVLVVKCVKPDGQAEEICLETLLKPEIFKGAVILAINNVTYDADGGAVALWDELIHPNRPKSILFALNRAASPHSTSSVRRSIGINKIYGYNLVELVMTDETSNLGIRFHNEPTDECKVALFNRKQEAYQRALDCLLDPVIFNDASIIAVNGRKYTTRENMINALQSNDRPMPILFELAQAPARCNVSSLKKVASSIQPPIDIVPTPARSQSMRSVLEEEEEIMTGEHKNISNKDEQQENDQPHIAPLREWNASSKKKLNSSLDESMVPVQQNEKKKEENQESRNDQDQENDQPQIIPSRLWNGKSETNLTESMVSVQQEEENNEDEHQVNNQPHETPLPEWNTPMKEEMKNESINNLSPILGDTLSPLQNEDELLQMHPPPYQDLSKFDRIMVTRGATTTFIYKPKAQSSPEKPNIEFNASTTTAATEFTTITIENESMLLPLDDNQEEDSRSKREEHNSRDSPSLLSPSSGDGVSSSIGETERWETSSFDNKWDGNNILLHNDKEEEESLVEKEKHESDNSSHTCPASPSSSGNSVSSSIGKAERWETSSPEHYEKENHEEDSLMEKEGHESDNSSDTCPTSPSSAGIVVSSPVDEAERWETSSPEHYENENHEEDSLMEKEGHESDNSSDTCPSSSSSSGNDACRPIAETDRWLTSSFDNDEDIRRSFHMHSNSKRFNTIKTMNNTGDTALFGDFNGNIDSLVSSSGSQQEQPHKRNRSVTQKHYHHQILAPEEEEFRLSFFREQERKEQQAQEEQVVFDETYMSTFQPEQQSHKDEFGEYYLEDSLMEGRATSSEDDELRQNALQKRRLRLQRQRRVGGRGGATVPFSNIHLKKSGHSKYNTIKDPPSCQPPQQSHRDEFEKFGLSFFREQKRKQQQEAQGELAVGLLDETYMVPTSSSEPEEESHQDKLFEYYSKDSLMEGYARKTASDDVGEYYLEDPFEEDEYATSFEDDELRQNALQKRGLRLQLQRRAGVGSGRGGTAVPFTSVNLSFSHSKYILI